MASATQPKGRKMKSNSKMKATNLHIDMMKWATNEMKFQTHLQNSNSKSQCHLPSEEDFKSLCTGPLADVWKYVVSHVKSVQTAKHVKGNVELKKSLGALNGGASGAGDGTEEEREKRQILGQKKVRLSQELQQIKAETSQLHRELGHARDELAGTEHSYQSVCQGVRDLQRKENLLLAAHCSAGETTTRYAEYVDRVEKCVAEIMDKKEESQGTFMETDDEELETESCHMVRQACEDIDRFLFHSLDSSADTSQLEKRKSDLLDKVDRAAAINSTRSLLAALATNADRDATKLRQRTVAIDIGKDAAKISFSYSPKAGLQDLSCAPSATETVKQLLHASSEQHVMRWFKTQEHLNQEWKLSSRQTEILGELDKLLARLIGNHPAHLAAAKNYVSSRMQLAEERAVAPCLMKEVTQLGERIDTALRERQELKLKHSQIQDFQKLVAKKQAIISKLARLNANAPERLKSHRQQVESYLESRSVLTHLAEVRALPVSLKGALISELECFLQLLMSCLLTVALDSHMRVCALDLSISPDIYALVYEEMQTYTDVCKALEFPAFKCVDSLPLHVLGVHSSLHKLQETHRQREITAAAVLREAGTTDSIDSFIDLNKTASESDAAQCKKLLPQLREAAHLVQEHAAWNESLRKAVATWWEQPAQWTTPWVRCQNLTFGQWMQRWTTAMTNVHSKVMARRGGAGGQL